MSTIFDRKIFKELGFNERTKIKRTRAVASEIVKALGIVVQKPELLVRPGDVRLLSFDMGDAAQHFGVSRNTISQRTRKKDLSQLELWNETHV